MEVTSGIQVRHTPLKRCRSPVASRLCDLAQGIADDTATDNMRQQKRYLSEVMATDLSRLNVNHGDDAHDVSSTKGLSSDSMQMDRDGDSPSGVSSLQLGNYSPQACVTPRLPDLNFRPRFSTAAPCSPSTSSVSGMACSPVEDRKPPWTPMSMMTLCRDPNLTPLQASRLARLTTPAEKAEMLPPSPSDPQLAMDLRKTAIIRSLLKNNEEKASQTPGWEVRTRTRARHADGRPPMWRPMRSTLPETSMSMEMADASSVCDDAHSQMLESPPPRMRTDLMRDSNL